MAESLLKTVLVGTVDTAGGAARAMYRLHKGFLQTGVQSHIICRYRFSSDPFSVTAEKEPDSGRTAALFQKYINENRSDISNTIFTYAYPGYDISTEPMVREADVINLHWVAGFQSPLSVVSLLNTGKPVIWTLHDEWAFTGGCHYSAGCEGFLNDCRSCPQIRTPDSLIAKTVISDKLKFFRDRITVISPSEWLASEARRSSLFRNSEIRIIPNSVETDLFFPYKKAEAKAHWGIPSESFTMLFGAENGNERRKGFRELTEALQVLTSDSEWGEAVQAGRIRLISFGIPSAEIQSLGIPYTTTGHIKDDALMAKIYSAADLFILPSREDNLPNTMLESLSCATPVLAFRAGGMPDLIKEGFTGYLAEPFRPESLAAELRKAWKNQEERTAFGHNGRIEIEKKYSLSIQAENYHSLCSELIGLSNTRLSRNTASLKNQVSDSVSFNQTETYKNLSQLKTETCDWLYAQSENIIAERNRFEADMHYMHRLIHDDLTNTQIFFGSSDSEKSENKVYISLPISKEFKEFKMEINVPAGARNLRDITLMPFWKSAGIIDFAEISVVTADGKKTEADLQSITGNYFRREGNRIYFLTNHTVIYLKMPIDSSVILIKGTWKILPSHKAHLAIKEVINQQRPLLYQLKLMRRRWKGFKDDSV